MECEQVVKAKRSGTKWINFLVAREQRHWSSYIQLVEGPLTAAACRQNSFPSGLKEQVRTKFFLSNGIHICTLWNLLVICWSHLFFNLLIFLPLSFRLFIFSSDWRINGHLISISITIRTVFISSIKSSRHLFQTVLLQPSKTKYLYIQK